MESLYAYLPTDRVCALARGAELPDLAQGAALFADISGFTPLTESLLCALGAERGAEELTCWLNRIYDALIDEVDTHGGSVISFGGDAITCWFDDRGLDLEGCGAIRPAAQGIPPALPSGSLRATACALAMQKAMQRFAHVETPAVGVVELAMKIAVASGPIRRFVVGDPDILLIDAVAGGILDRLVAGEHQANKGDVVLDEATVQALGEQITVLEWRFHDEHNLRFAVLGAVNTPVQAYSRPRLTLETLNDDQLRPWLLHPVYERLRSGEGELLTELRPTVPLFLHFGGIDFDRDVQAQSKLDIFIRAVQRVLSRHGGYLLQLVIGDKGCYLYASFGAPVAHEDNALRAVSAALEIRDLRLEFITDLQIGISQGVTRTGAYGGPSRRTYSAMGDAVNLAARLMGNAAPGEVLVSGRVHSAVESWFVFEPRPPLPLKGKAEPLPVFAATGARKKRAIRLQEPTYALPMIGRIAEVQLINEKLELALRNKAQVIGIVSDPGLGKSRLVAEVIRLAHKKGFVGYGGSCQSDGVNRSYLAWKSIWSALFDVDPEFPPRKQMRLLEGEIEDRAPSRVQAMPLLSSVLDLEIPDNEFTRSLEPKYRKTALHALLEECLCAASQEQPLLIVIEDVHWIDALSLDLLEELMKALADSPISIVLAYRPQQLGHLVVPRLESLPAFTRIELHELTRGEAEQAIRAKLAQLYPAQAGAVPPQLVDRLMERAQGNPFYLEELLNYLRDRGLDPRDPADLNKIELPDSLHTLVLSRLDQLSERKRTTLRVASIIGRLFPAEWLAGYYPALGELAHIKVDLDELGNLDITPLDSTEPELSYLFKHIVLHQVTYESLPFAMRAQLHEQLATYLELRVAAGQFSEVSLLDTLVYHYAHSENQDKQRKYLLMAGEAAQAAYANTAAISYYRRAIPLQPANQQAAVLLKLGQVLELMGEWQEAEDTYRQAEALTVSCSEAQGRARAQHALGCLLRKQGKYGESESFLEQARTGYEQSGDAAGVSRVLADMGEIQRLQGRFTKAHSYYDESLKLTADIADPATRQAARAYALKGAGTVATWQGDYAGSRKLNEESLEIRRELGDTPGVATLLNNLGIIARFQHDLAGARRMNEESLALFRKIGDRWALGQLLNNQACVASDEGNYVEARSLLEESLCIRRQLGDKAGLALSLNTLADVVLDEGDVASVRPLLDESLAINRALGDQTAIAYLIEDYAGLASIEGHYQCALQLAAFAAALRENIGAPLPPAEQARADRMIAPARDALDEGCAAAIWEAGRSLTLEQAIALVCVPGDDVREHGK